MKHQTAHVRIPASTANLGPGFDCLGLSLDLWNEAYFTLGGKGIQVEIEGEGKGKLVEDAHNMIARSVLAVFQEQKVPLVTDFKIKCINRIPLESGMGSSAAAALAGILGANALLDNPMSKYEILRMASVMEGHSDNTVAALWGGLVVTATETEKPLFRQFDIPQISAAVVVPSISFSTRIARAALPEQVKRSDAVFNAGRTALVIEALRNSDLDLLRNVLDDRLHQPYRLPLIPGAKKALAVAQRAGAAVALSGAGPGLIAFTKEDPTSIAKLISETLQTEGTPNRSFILTSTNKGAEVTVQ